MKLNNTITFDVTEGFSSLPTYNKVAEFLQNNIRNGIFKHGMNLPPEPALAEKLGISRVTLRHALKNLEQKGLIIRRRGRSGGNFICVPGEKTNICQKTLGLLCNLKNPKREPYFLDILEGIQSQLGENVNLLLTSTIGNSILDFYHINRLDGIFIINPPLENTAILDSLLLEAIPHAIISVSPKHIDNKNLILIDTDNQAGSIAAIQYLVNIGHRQIAYIGGYPGHSNSLERLESYKTTLEKNGIQVDPGIICTKKKEYENDSFVKDTVRKMLSSQNPPTAIFAAGFTLAMETIVELKNSGMSVPDDISIVGFDDFEPSINTPFLTTVRQPLVELGQRAAIKMMEWLNTGSVKEKQLILPNELIIRKSCKTL